MNSIKPQFITDLKLFFEKSHIDETHGYHHAMEVGQHVINAGGNKKDILAGFLHDVDDRKYFDHKDYRNARSLLKIHYPYMEDDVIKRIDVVSFSKNGNFINKQILKDEPTFYYARHADRICAIMKGRGIERCRDYNAIEKRPLFVDETPMPTCEDEVWLNVTKDRINQYLIKKTSVSFLDHFYDKLLHIDYVGIPYFDEIIAESKSYMVQFLINVTNAKDRCLYIKHYEQFL